MELNFFEIQQHHIAEVISDKIVINNPQDALDIIAEANYHGADRIIVYEQHLPEAFFELRTGLAGEILQKCANYRMKLAVIGTFEKFKSNSLQAFIGESNRGQLAFFVSDRATAIAKLTGTN